MASDSKTGDDYDIVPWQEVGFSHLMTVDEANGLQSEVVAAMDAKWPNGYGICVLEGGKISGGAYGGVLEAGEFIDKDYVGFAVMAQYNPGKFQLVPKDKIGYKTLASIPYAEAKQEEIVTAMDKKWPAGWGICRLEGGKISGSGYGGKIELGAGDYGYALMVKWDGDFDIVPLSEVGYKALMTIPEAEKEVEKIVGSMDKKWPAGWGLCVLHGGKITGSGYGGKIVLGSYYESQEVGYAVMQKYA